jgi:hypothetical protein
MNKINKLIKIKPCFQKKKKEKWIRQKKKRKVFPLSSLLFNRVLGILAIPSDKKRYSLIKEYINYLCLQIILFYV